MLGTLESQQRSEEAGTGEQAGGKKAAREEPCHQVAEEGLAGPGQAFAFYSELVASHWEGLSVVFYIFDFSFCVSPSKLQLEMGN